MQTIPAAYSTLIVCTNQLLLPKAIQIYNITVSLQGIQYFLSSFSDFFRLSHRLYICRSSQFANNLYWKSVLTCFFKLICILSLWSAAGEQVCTSKRINPARFWESSKMCWLSSTPTDFRRPLVPQRIWLCYESSSPRFQWKQDLCQQVNQARKLSKARLMVDLYHWDNTKPTTEHWWIWSLMTKTLTAVCFW